MVPRTLAENAGLNATNVVSSLYAAHARGTSTQKLVAYDFSTRSKTDVGLERVRFLTRSTQVDEVFAMMRAVGLVMMMTVTNAGLKYAGVDIEGENGGIVEDASARSIQDLYITKQWALVWTIYIR